MNDRDPESLADELEGEADRLGQQSDRLKEQTGEVREDWERKRADEGVPGAPAPDEAEASSGSSPAWGNDSGSGEESETGQ